MYPVSFKSFFLFPVQNFPLQLLPRPQRGAFEATAQAWAASALVAETGAAESEITWRKETGIRPSGYWHGPHPELTDATKKLSITYLCITENKQGSSMHWHVDDCGGSGITIIYIFKKLPGLWPSS